MSLIFNNNNKRFNSHSIWQVLLPFVGLALWPTLIYTECNVCQANQVACINTSSFYLCFGGNTPNMNTLYHCKDGFDCTNLTAICVQASSQRQPSCGNTVQCGLCSTQRNYLFACQSRSTFQMCYGAARPNGQWGHCPSGYVCDANSDAICVPDTDNATITCDLSDELVYPHAISSTNSDSDSTTEMVAAGNSTEASTSTHETTAQNNGNKMADEICQAHNEIGLYPLEPNDITCKSYVFCYSVSGNHLGLLYTCVNGSYFNSQLQVCTTIKPDYCI